MLALVLSLFISAAHAHSWYPPECCSGQDCRPVPRSEAQYDDRGLWIVINGTWRLMPLEKIREQPSPDSEFHVCFSQYSPPMSTQPPPAPTIYCVFVPASM